MTISPSPPTTISGTKNGGAAYRRNENATIKSINHQNIYSIAHQNAGPTVLKNWERAVYAFNPWAFRKIFKRLGEQRNSTAFAITIFKMLTWCLTPRFVFWSPTGRQWRTGKNISLSPLSGEYRIVSGAGFFHGWQIYRYDQKTQADLTAFANQWLSNIKKQRFLAVLSGNSG